MLPPVGSTQLANGRFAMIDDGIGFPRVPWRPVLDKRIGQNIGFVMRNVGGTEWSFGRQQGWSCHCCEGAMRDPDNITCLLPWGRTGAIRSRLAHIARPRFAAGGLDRTSSDPAGARHTGKVN